MRFQRCAFRFERQAITKQRLVAARKAIERERQRDGLFAEGKTYETPEERLERLECERKAWVQRLRAQYAAEWKRIRAALFALPAEKRRELLAAWKTCGYPATPEYMAAFLRKHGVSVRPDLDAVAAEVRRIREAVEQEMAQRRTAFQIDATEQMTLSELCIAPEVMT